MNRTICLAEDRQGAEIGLKLAVLSLDEFCPDLPVVMYRPDPLPAFSDWLRDFPQVRLIPHLPEGAHSWNCKPHALLPWLNSEPDSEVIWLDSDQMVTRDPRVLLEKMSPETLAISQEAPSQPDQGSRIRTEGWGFPVGRALPFSINSSVFRITHHHRQLMLRWHECLDHPEYLSWSRQPVNKRPSSHMSDQDVLGALLGSKEFEQVPIGLFVNGRDIIHCGGALAYSFSDRLRGLFLPRPTFLHAISLKPWMILGNPQLRAQRWWWWRCLHQELSEYVSWARRYESRLGEPTPWLHSSTGLGNTFRLLGFGHWALRGLPITVMATVARKLSLG